MPDYQSFSTEKRLTRIQDSYKLGYLVEDVKVQYKKALNVSLTRLLSIRRKATLARFLGGLLRTSRSREMSQYTTRTTLAYVSRTLNLERIARAHDFSGINADFYIRVNDYLSSLDEKDRERIIVSLNSFVVSRIEKIVKLAASPPH